MRKDYFNEKGVLCGYLIDGIYRKHVKRSKHLLRVMEAWGVDKVIISDLEALKTQSIRIKDDESGIIYAVTLERFIELGVERDFGELQVFLPLKYWEIV